MLSLDDLCVCKPVTQMELNPIISYHLFSFRGYVQNYKIHMDMEIIKFT